MVSNKIRRRKNTRRVRKNTRRVRKNTRKINRNINRRQNTRRVRRQNTRKINRNINRRQNTRKINRNINRRQNTRRKKKTSRDKIKGGWFWTQKKKTTPHGKFLRKNSKPLSDGNINTLLKLSDKSMTNLSITDLPQQLKRNLKTITKHGNVLGRGSGGHIYEYPGDPSKCVKVVVLHGVYTEKSTATQLSLKEFYAECGIMKMVDQIKRANPHKYRDIHIVQMYAFTVAQAPDDTDITLGLILMDKLDKTLSKYLEENPSKDITTVTNKLSIAKAIFKSIKMLNENGIAHNDIKPDNIMLDRNLNVYLVDFGAAGSILSTGYLGEGNRNGSLPYGIFDTDTKTGTKYPYDLLSFAGILISMFIVKMENIYREVSKMVSVGYTIVRNKLYEYLSKNYFSNDSHNNFSPWTYIDIDNNTIKANIIAVVSVILMMEFDINLEMLKKFMEMLLRQPLFQITS